MNTGDYYKYQQQQNFLHQLDERLDSAIMIIHLLDEKIEALKKLSVNLDFKVIKPIKADDIFKF